MYEFVTAVLKRKGKNTAYKPVNISLQTLRTVHESYDDGHIELRNAALSPDPYYVDFRTLRQSNLPFSNVAFETWLQTLGDRILPTIPTAPTYTENVVLYSQASQAGYDFVKVDPNSPVVNPYACHNEDVEILPANMTDVMVTKVNISHSKLHDYCLFTLNGFLHRKVAMDTGILMKDAGESAKRQSRNTVGILSFLKVGKLTELSFNDDWVHVIKPGSTFTHGIVLETGIDLTGKSVLCSIMGSLHGEDKLIDILSYERGTIKLNIGEVEWIRRLLDAQDYIDLAPLGLSRSEIRRRAFSVSETRTDEFYRNLLKLSQSFLIIVDTPRLYFTEEALTTTGFNGLLDAPNPPFYPLYHHTRRFQEYWRSYDNGKWLVHVADSLYPDYVFETTPWMTDHMVDDTIEEVQHKLIHMVKICNSLRDGA